MEKKGCHLYNKLSRFEKYAPHNPIANVFLYKITTLRCLCVPEALYV